MSIRIKFILSLIGMSFLAVTLAGVSARTLVLDRFENFVIERASEGFMREVLVYYRTFGSWEAAAAAEPFIVFALRIAPEGTLQDPVPGGRPPPPPAGLPPRPVSDPAALDNLPPHQVPPGDSPSQQRRLPEFGDAAPPPPFVATDMDGKVWVPSPLIHLGSMIPLSDLKKALPIMDGDQQIGYAISHERLSLTEMEENYLRALNESWWFAMLIVAAIAIPTGFVFGARLTAPINRLSKAINKVNPEAIDQSVPVSSNDEIGALSRSFNAMSKELSLAYKELEDSRAQLEELSLEDPLTGLPNRRAFDKTVSVLISHERREPRSTVLAIIDIDHFKSVNDNFSHATGDRVLQKLSEILLSNLRKGDFITRFGGEEFVVLLPDTELEKAASLIDRLRTNIAESSWADIDSDIGITISAGVAKLEDTSSEAVLKALDKADKKLYEAKNNGRNQVVF